MLIGSSHITLIQHNLIKPGPNVPYFSLFRPAQRVPLNLHKKTGTAHTSPNCVSRALHTHSQVPLPSLSPFLARMQFTSGRWVGDRALFGGRLVSSHICVLTEKRVDKGRSQHTPNVQIIRRCRGVVRRLSHVQQVAVDIVLHDEAGRVEPRREAIN